VTTAVVVVLAIAAWMAYRFLLVRSFVAAGRGALDSAQVVQVISVTSANSTLDFSGTIVQAGSDHKYALVDIHISAPAGKVDFNDFQLVKEKVSQLGEERISATTATEITSIGPSLMQQATRLPRYPARRTHLQRASPSRSQGPLEPGTFSTGGSIGGRWILPITDAADPSVVSQHLLLEVRLTRRMVV